MTHRQLTIVNGILLAASKAAHHDGCMLVLVKEETEYAPAIIGGTYTRLLTAVYYPRRGEKARTEILRPARVIKGAGKVRVMA